MEAPREKTVFFIIVVRRKMKQQSPEGEQIVEVEEIHTYVPADGHHDNHMVQYCVNELLPFNGGYDARSAGACPFPI